LNGLLEKQIILGSYSFCVAVFVVLKPRPLGRKFFGHDRAWRVDLHVGILAPTRFLRQLAPSLNGLLEQHIILGSRSFCVAVFIVLKPRPLGEEVIPGRSFGGGGQVAG
jgi:hypothetical protein